MESPRRPPLPLRPSTNCRGTSARSCCRNASKPRRRRGKRREGATKREVRRPLAEARPQFPALLPPPSPDSPDPLAHSTPERPGSSGPKPATRSGGGGGAAGHGVHHGSLPRRPPSKALPPCTADLPNKDGDDAWAVSNERGRKLPTRSVLSCMEKARSAQLRRARTIAQGEVNHKFARGVLGD